MSPQPVRPGVRCHMSRAGPCLPPSLKTEMLCSFPLRDKPSVIFAGPDLGSLHVAVAVAQAEEPLVPSPSWVSGSL